MRFLFAKTTLAIRSVGKLKGFFKGNAAPKKGGDDDEAEEGQQRQQQQQQHVLETDAEEPAVSARKVEGTILLETNVKFGGLSPMTVEEKRAARDR